MSLSIEPEQVRGAAGQIGSASQRFQQALDRFASELQSYGQPWGGDTIGSLIGAAYDEVHEWAFECFGQAAGELGDMAQDLDIMADSHEATDRQIAQHLSALCPGAG